jgi:hypothetical protein
MKSSNEGDPDKDKLLLELLTLLLKRPLLAALDDNFSRHLNYIKL